MKTVLVICPSRYEYTELEREPFCSNYRFIFKQYDAGVLYRALGGCSNDSEQTLADPQKFVDELIRECKKNNVDAVISTEDFPGSLFASIVAQKIGLMAPTLASLLVCQHKFYARCKFNEIVPEIATECALINPEEPFFPKSLSCPFFLKPVKSRTSMRAERVESVQNFEKTVAYVRVPKVFKEIFEWFLNKADFPLAQGDALIAEELLQGDQTTVEGYVFNGKVSILGAVDSIMHPGTYSFARFEYPSRFPLDVQERMFEIAKAVMKGIGFDNGFFNIEFFYHAPTGRLAMIEVNPRLCCQFPDLYEKVDGTSSLELLISLALGKEPKITKNNGEFNCAAIFVPRLFEDVYVQKMPSKVEVEQAKKRFPELRFYHYAQERKRLSEFPQDGKSYRYGLTHLGGMNWLELYQKFDECQRLLPFELIKA